MNEHSKVWQLQLVKGAALAAAVPCGVMRCKGTWEAPMLDPAWTGVLEQVASWHVSSLCPCKRVVLQTLRGDAFTQLS
jgi:hypothetical protein